MIKYYSAFIVILFCASFSFAQEVTYDLVKKQYESFQFDSVIKMSDQLIQKGGLSDSLTIEMYIMRANIFYQRNDDLSTKNSFNEILKIQKNYVPDPSNLSPKLISIFTEVKAEYLRKNPEIIQRKDTVLVNRDVKFGDPLLMRNARIQSLLLPGLGQLYLGYKSKGWLETAVSVANLGALVYFYLDTNKKEKDYLNESDLILMQQKYNDYNKSYKARNVLFITYAALLIYSQIDLTFFSNEPPVDISVNDSIPEGSPVSLNDIQLNFRFRF